MAELFTGKVGLIQRVLPSYRRPFFDRLAERCTEGLSVFAGQPRPGEAIHSASELKVAQHFPAKNRHWLGGPMYVCWQSGLEEWLEAWQPEALIIEANPRYLSSRGAIDWMRERQGAVIAWGLGSGRGGGLASRLTGGWRRNFLSRFDAAIAYSREGLDSFEALGLPSLKLYHAPNVVMDAPKRKPQARKNAVPRVLFVGRLQARKGVERLIAASQDLQQDLAHELRIIGSGPEKARLEAMVGDAGQNIGFVGALFGAELEGEFERADLFVLPGTGGLAIQQAMSYGVAVIAGEGDGTQGDLVDESNGWQLASAEIGELSDTLRAALSDRAALAAKGHASYEKVKTRFNLEHMADVFVQALNEVSG